MSKYVLQASAEAPAVPLPPFSEEAREAVLKGTKTCEDIERETREFQEWKMARRKLYGYPKEIPCHTFLNETAAEFLTGCERSNTVYSPFSLYHALLILAELCGGSTREEILRILGDMDLQKLGNAFACQLAENCSRGGYTALPSASLWLDSAVDADREKMQETAGKFVCPVYSGNMNDSGYLKAIRNWINEASGMGSAGSVPIPEDLKMMLVTTLRFRAAWRTEFEAKDTEKGLFHTAHGDTLCRYMRMSSWENVWIGNGFKALQLSFAKMGCMWFVLPDEGKTPKDILQSGVFSDHVPPFGTNGSVREWNVNMSVPRFSISESLGLRERLQKLGINKVFGNESETPFTRMGEKMIAVDELQQDTEIRVNEKGCEGSARTIGMCICSGAFPEPPPPMDFILDRPFLFAVYGRGDLPLFLGVVNRPDEN